MKKLMVLSVVSLFVFLGQSDVAGSIQYDVVDLETLIGNVNSINNMGTVVGSVRNSLSAPSKAVIFDTTGGGNHIYLGSLGGVHGIAVDINENGDIVGWSWFLDNSHHVAVFDASGAGSNIDIGKAGYAHAEGNSINDVGQIVGVGFLSANDGRNGLSHAVFFDETGNGNDIYLGTLGGAYGYATDINNAGVIIGRAMNANGYNRAVVYDATGSGSNFDLGTLGGLISEARDINESDQIVGRADDNNGNARATLFGTYSGGNNLDLGTLGGDKSKTWAINELGEIVGLAEDADGNQQATMFDPTGAGANIDLNDLIDPLLGINLTAAKDINDLGQIVCYGYDSFGNSHTYLLNPVPEPLAVTVDIKPKSCPNQLNIKSSGILSVAILGSNDVDVNEIVEASIQLAGVDAIRYSFKDVAGPALDTEDCNCTTDRKDGFLDLTLKFKTQRIVEAMGQMGQISDGETWILELTGMMLDERPITGADCVIIRDKHKPR